MTRTLEPRRILITNDDGIEAPGIKLLERVAQRFASEVWVVAPLHEQSGKAHGMTIHTGLKVEARGARHYAVSGTPTDCVFVAINKVLKERPPELVLSGINVVENVGEDLTYSGTVAAAIEATLLGFPAIALSQMTKIGHPPRWDTAEHWAPLVLERLLVAGWPGGVLINVNFPDRAPYEVPGIIAAPQGRHAILDVLEERVDEDGVVLIRRPVADGLYLKRFEQAKTPGNDLDVIVNQGAVAVTPIQLDLTHRDTLRHLRETLALKT